MLNRISHVLATLSLVCLLLWGLTSCGSSDNGGGDGGSSDAAGLDGGSDGGVDGGGSLVPRDGLWSYSEFNAIVDQCNSGQLITNGAGNFLLVYNGNRTFTVTPADGSSAFDCTLTGADFTCPDRAAAVEDFTTSGFDAILTLNVAVSGTFSDAETMTGQQQGTANCVGTACGGLAGFLGTTFPCSVTVDFTAAWTTP